jgi:hypothetical protein
MSAPNPRPFRDPDLLQVGEALRRAANSATALALRTGTPLYVWRDGRIVNIGAAVSTEANSVSKATASS